MRRVFFICAGASVVAGLLFYAISVHTQRSITELRQDVSKFVPHETLEANNAQDLRLYRFWLQTTHDPILALPGVNLDELEKSVRALEQTQETYIHFYTPKERKKIREIFRPFSFLALLTPLESARRDFLEHPSYRTALAYSYTLTETLSTYESHARLLSKFFEEHAEDEKEISYLGGRVTFEHIAATLSTLGSHANAIAETQNMRRLCLLGTYEGDECTPRVPRIAPALQNAPPTTTPPAYRNQNYEAVRSYMQKDAPFSISLSEITNVPRVYVPFTSCTYQGDATYYFLWKKSRSSDITALWSEAIDDLIFIDPTKRKDLLARKLRASDIAYEWQPLNPYFCINTGIDSGLVRTSYYIYDNLLHNPVVRNVDFTPETPQEIAALKELEIEIIKTSGEILNAADIERYAMIASELLQEDHNLLLSYIPRSALNQLSEIVLLWRSQSAWFETEIGRIDDIEASNVALLNAMLIPLDEFVLARSYPSSMYLTSNTTLLPEPTSLLKNTTKTPLEDMYFTTYNTFLRTIISPETLPQFLSEQHEKGRPIYSRPE